MNLSKPASSSHRYWLQTTTVQRCSGKISNPTFAMYEPTMLCDFRFCLYIHTVIGRYLYLPSHNIVISCTLYCSAYFSFCSGWFNIFSNIVWFLGNLKCFLFLLLLPLIPTIGVGNLYLNNSEIKKAIGKLFCGIGNVFLIESTLKNK